MEHELEHLKGCNFLIISATLLSNILRQLLVVTEWESCKAVWAGGWNTPLACPRHACKDVCLPRVDGQLWHKTIWPEMILFQRYIAPYPDETSFITVEAGLLDYLYILDLRVISRTFELCTAANGAVLWPSL